MFLLAFLKLVDVRDKTKQSLVKLKRYSHIRLVAKARDYFLSAPEMRYTTFGGDNYFVLKAAYYLLTIYYVACNRIIKAIRYSRRIFVVNNVLFKGLPALQAKRTLLTTKSCLSHLIA